MSLLLQLIQFNPLTDWVVGARKGRFSRYPLPVFSAGGHCGQFWHRQWRPLFDVVHPESSPPTTASINAKDPRRTFLERLSWPLLTGKQSSWGAQSTGRADKFQVENPGLGRLHFSNGPRHQRVLALSFLWFFCCWFFNRGNTEGTNSSKTLCFMFVYVFVFFSCKFVLGLILCFLEKLWFLNLCAE